MTSGKERVHLNDPNLKAKKVSRVINNTTNYTLEEVILATSGIRERKSPFECPELEAKKVARVIGELIHVSRSPCIYSTKIVL